MTAYIPQKTLNELNSVHPVGTRHRALIDIALPLIGNGLSDQIVFAMLREKFDSDKTDAEIYGVISWCRDKNPSPSVPSSARTVFTPRTPLPPTTPKKEIPPEQMCEDFLGGFKCGIEETIQRSTVEIGLLESHAPILLANLYEATEKINIVCRFTVNEKGKANPQGGGKTMPRDAWIQWIAGQGTPASEAGAWIRLNPTSTETGSGKGGAITDSDISAFRFLLIESDVLPLDTQLSLYAKWKLPIAAIILSGGGSAHAWVRLDAKDETQYDAWVKRILTAIAPFGFDQSNKNPSRLSRLPGAKRKIQAQGNGEQRLIYINGACGAFSEESLAAFEAQVKPPFMAEMPMKNLARRSVDRYEELHRNRGATGLRTGFTSFDTQTGGLKKGNFVVIAGQTGGGKTTLALNIVNRAIQDRKTTALFTLEMDEGEIVDVLVSLNFHLDRNLFNTGNFTDRDLCVIANGLAAMSKWPLYIFDNPNTNVDEIRETCLKLKECSSLSLIVVDYLQLVAPPAMFRESREQQIAYIGRALKNLAKECKVPVIAVSQLNEEGKIRESRSVAHDANIVFILEESNLDSELILRITKGRSVKKGQYKMRFEPIHCKITEQSKFGNDYADNNN